jgi:hypothetical protein
MTKDEENVLIKALGTERGKAALRDAMLNPIRSKQSYVPSDPTPESISDTLGIVNRKLENKQDWDEETLKACAWMKPRLEKWLEANK